MPVSSDARAGYGGGERRNFTAPPSGGMGDRSFSSEYMFVMFHARR
ncbi:MAG: hypothetical protein INR71_15375 [Terriglobus roseus]|nr:hypothetical protein [Terriglobus roseus]